MSQQNINISTPDDGLGDVLRNSFYKTNQNFTELYNGKVDKVTGKGLSKNDFTDLDKGKLDGIEAGAEVNVQADWGETDPFADSFILNKPPLLYASVGHFHYNDSATHTTPLVVLPSVPKKLTNDTLGEGTEKDFAPYGVADVWETTVNAFTFSPLDLGDQAQIRFDFLLSSTSPSQKFTLYVKFGVGSPSEYDMLVSSWVEKDVITYGQIIRELSFSIDNKNWLFNPAEIYILSDKDASVKVNGWYIPIIRKSLNIIDFNSDPLKLDKVSTAGVERAYIINADGSQGTKATSEWVNANLDNYLVNITTPSPNHTGTSVETNITSYNFVIPANTLSDGDTLRIENMLWEKIGVANASNCRLKISNTNNFATANQVAIFFNSSANIYMRACRTFNINSGLLRGVSFTANGIFNDFTLTNLGFSTLALDFTQPIYGFISLQVTNPADIILMRELKIRKI